jgi:AcrR family transcriptional regulator
MARPLSEEKRQAILAAATDAIATVGVAASTAKIATAAEVSEGTIFTYFATKDELLNQLYLELKDDLGRAMLATYPAKAGLRERAHHVWDRLIEWGHTNPAKNRAMKQLSVSDKITPASRNAGNAVFEEVNNLLSEARSGTSPAFCGAILEALSEKTVDFMRREPDRADAHKAAGFAFFWKGLTG